MIEIFNYFSKLKKFMSSSFIKAGVLPWFLGVALITFSFASDNFLTTQNILGVARHSSDLILVAMAQMVVMLTGGLDFSVGVILAMTSVVASMTMVALWSGYGSGWEAILNGVPVLSPVENFWDCMQLSRKSSDIESLHDDIKQAVTDNNKINQAERRKRVACFLEALIKNSFTISNPEVFAYYYQGTKEQYSLQGIELGRGIIKFLKKSNIDKSIGNKKFFCI